MGQSRTRKIRGDGWTTERQLRFLDAPNFAAQPEVHIDALSNGRLMRLLGTHFRRERGDFRCIGKAAAERRAT